MTIYNVIAFSFLYAMVLEKGDQNYVDVLYSPELAQKPATGK